MSLSLPILPFPFPSPLSPLPPSLLSSQLPPSSPCSPHTLTWYHGNHSLRIQLPSNEWTYPQRHRGREGDTCMYEVHVRTTDAHPIEGMSLPHCYAIRIMSMEGVASYIEFYFKLWGYCHSVLKYVSFPPHSPTCPLLPFSPLTSSLLSSQLPPSSPMLPIDFDLLYGTMATVAYAFNCSIKWTYHQRHRRREGEITTLNWIVKNWTVAHPLMCHSAILW